MEQPGTGQPAVHASITCVLSDHSFTIEDVCQGLESWLLWWCTSLPYSMSNDKLMGDYEGICALVV